MARVLLVTTYNPGAAGPRFIAGCLMEAGHSVQFIHLKELRAVAIPTTNFAEHERLQSKKGDVAYVSFQHPGERLYVPFPSEITEREWELFVDEIKQFKPDLVGISMFSVTVEVARRCTQRIHDAIPGMKVAWGGIHCMVNPEDCVKDRGKANCPDVVCVGEGEGPFTTLVNGWDAYAAGERADIPGIWYVDGDKVKRSGMTPLEQDLDNIAFPSYADCPEVMIDDDAKDMRYSVKDGFIQNHICVFTERGCPYSCSFCIHSVINKLDDGHNRIRRRSVDDVLEEVEIRVRENKLNHIYIHDEIFAIQKKWIMEFAEKWEKRFKKRGITFTGYVHPMCTDGEMVEALFHAGLTRTGIGIQTGSYRVSKDIYDRPLNVDRIVECSRQVSLYPFELVQLDLISDSPYETEEDRRDTLRLLLQLYPPFRVETFGLVTYKTSTLVEKERQMDEVPWNERLFWNMLYHLTGTTWLSRDTILEMSYDTYLKENPLVLEKLVCDIQGEHFKKIEGHIRMGDEKADLTKAARDAAKRAETHRMLQAGNGQRGGEQLWTGYRMKSVIKSGIRKAAKLLTGGK